MSDGAVPDFEPLTFTQARAGRPPTRQEWEAFAAEWDAKRAKADTTRSDALRAALPADFYETASDDDRRFITTILGTIDHAVMHPTDGAAINKRIAEIIARSDPS